MKAITSIRSLPAVLAGVAALAGFDATAAERPTPVLMVIANQDFHFAEYAAVRGSLDANGLEVVVAAATPRAARPQDRGDEGMVQPDLALSDVNVDDYSAIVFVGGWGSSQYQYGFEGTYHNPAYRVQPDVGFDVNRLIKTFSAGDKPVAAICHGVTVLAWARVDGASPLQGRTVVASAGGMPAFTDGDLNFDDAHYPARWQIEANGARMLVSGSIGDPLSSADDVYIDGNIITAENYDSAGRFAEMIALSIPRSR